MSVHPTLQQLGAVSLFPLPGAHYAVWGVTIEQALVKLRLLGRILKMPLADLSLGQSQGTGGWSTGLAVEFLPPHSKAVCQSTLSGPSSLRCNRVLITPGPPASLVASGTQTK